MIEYKTGDLMNAVEDIIAHQVNCKGVMGSSRDVNKTTNVAHQLRMKYKDDLYLPYKKLVEETRGELLGNIQLLSMGDGKYICNMFSQGNYGYDRKQYTSLDALEICLKTLEQTCREMGLHSVAVPYKLASNRGGADWSDVERLLRKFFEDSEIKLAIYKL